MDVIKILDANHARRKWAEEREAADRAAEKRAAAQARAIRQARRKRLVLLTDAMLDPKVWAQVQAHKEEMYRTGRLKRPEPEGAMRNG